MKKPLTIQEIIDILNTIEDKTAFACDSDEERITDIDIYEKKSDYDNVIAMISY